jgi:Cu/Ag efflux pump CusA
MITSTLLTLLVVPAGYSVVESWRERRRAARVATGAAD